MRQFPWLSVLVFIALCAGCHSRPAASEETAAKTDSQAVVTASGSADQSVEANDFLIIAGKRVGPINPNTSEAELLQLLGPSIVTVADTIYGPEGDTFLGTTLYKKTADETQITYVDSARTRPEYVKIQPRFFDDDGNPINISKPTRWKTTDGLRIGTTLKELEQRNGKPFKLWGFGWDYGGGLSDWRGGKMSQLSKKSSVALTFGPPIPMTPRQQKAYDAVSGDSEFLSSGTNMQLLNPVVEVIGVGFDL